MKWMIEPDKNPLLVFSSRMSSFAFFNKLILKAK